jgi:AAA15 family ATPase/GTPase
LDECELKNLGKINVICGKNNSGKSTILQAIVNKENRINGRRITEEDFKGFIIGLTPLEFRVPNIESGP